MDKFDNREDALLLYHNILENEYRQNTDESLPLIFNNTNEVFHYILENNNTETSLKDVLHSFQIHLQQLKNTTMQTDNYDYLQKQLMYKGFDSEALILELKTNIEKGLPEFQLQHKEMYKRPDGKENQFDTILDFKKGKEGDRYFFNGFEAVLTKAEGEQMIQTFYNAMDKSFTKKEAYNLLDGRAVKKEINVAGKKFNAHLELDFSQITQNGNFYFKSYHENYGYDTGKFVDSLPLKEKYNEEKRAGLIASLDKGNSQLVTLDNGQKLYAATNPKYKTIQFSDAAGLPVKVAIDANQNISVSHFPSQKAEEPLKEQENVKTTEAEKQSAGIIEAAEEKASKPRSRKV